MFGVKVIPGEDSDLETLKFTWNVTSMDKDYLKIRLNFRKPIYVSSNVLKDKLQISFNQGYLFGSVNDKFV